MALNSGLKMHCTETHIKGSSIFTYEKYVFIKYKINIK